MRDQLSVTVDDQGTREGDRHIATLLEFFDGQVRMIGFVE